MGRGPEKTQRDRCWLRITPSCGGEDLWFCGGVFSERDGTSWKGLSRNIVQGLSKGGNLAGKKEKSRVSYGVPSRGESRATDLAACVPESKNLFDRKGDLPGTLTDSEGGGAKKGGLRMTRSYGSKLVGPQKNRIQKRK